MASVKTSVPVIVESSSEPVGRITSEGTRGHSQMNYQVDDLCFGVAVIIYHSKGIRTVKVRIWCVRPSPVVASIDCTVARF